MSVTDYGFRDYVDNTEVVQFLNDMNREQFGSLQLLKEVVTKPELIEQMSEEDLIEAKEACGLMVAFHRKRGSDSKFFEELHWNIVHQIYKYDINAIVNAISKQETE